MATSRAFHAPPEAKRRQLRNALLVAPAILVCLWFLATRPTVIWLILCLVAVATLIGSLAAWRQTRPIAEVTDESLTISGPFRSRSARWTQMTRLSLDTARMVGYAVTTEPSGGERTLLIPFTLLGPDASAELAELIHARRPDLA